MSRILYALCGMNLGHLSRAQAIARGLEARGHEVAFATGGIPLGRLRGTGAVVLEVPVVRQVVMRDRLRKVASLRANLGSLVWQRSIVRGLTERLASWAPDLVVSDYEPFSARAAAALGVPVVCLDHQQALTALDIDVPTGFRLEALLTAAVIRRTVAPRPAHTIVTSFFRAAVRDPARTTLVGPILRAEVLAARAEHGEHVLVYVNQGDGAALLDVLARVPARFVVYGGELAAAPGDRGRIVVRRHGEAGFLQDLAGASAVICTAGHTLMSEALHLGKRVLALPLRGTFEQSLNALALAAAGLGEAVFGRPPTVGEVSSFLHRAARAGRPPAIPPGNAPTLAILEAAA